MTRYYRPGFKALIAGTKHAMIARSLYDTGKSMYNSFTQKNKMAPVRKRARTSSSATYTNRKVNQSGDFGVPHQTKASAFTKGKRNTYAKKKKVRLPRGFRLKVEKALEPSEISGTWKQISYDCIPATNIPTNGQYVGGLAQASVNDYSDWAFDPEDYLHAASVLWNDKADSQLSRVWSGTGNLGIRVQNAAVGNVIPINGTASQNFYPMDLKLTIKNSHETYKLKNNTQRTLYMKIYLLSPKGPGMKTNPVTGPLVETLTLSSSANPLALGNPGQVWNNYMDLQAESNVNVASAVPQTLYQTPKSSPAMNKMFNMDETIVVLQPGQVYEYYIQGPSNFTLNYQSLFAGSDNSTPSYYQGIQKHMRYPLFTLYQDLVTDGDRTGRYVSSEATGGNLGVSLERIVKFSLSMPDRVGGRFSTGTGGDPKIGQYQLGSRRDCYFHKVYTAVGPTGDLQRVDVENPPMVVDAT